MTTRYLGLRKLQINNDSMLLSFLIFLFLFFHFLFYFIVFFRKARIECLIEYCPIAFTAEFSQCKLAIIYFLFQ